MPVIANYLLRGNPVDFAQINRAALPLLPSLVRAWCPQGRMCGHEWQALNPTRNDKTPGSFSINTKTGRWADFSTGDRGSDPISLAAYIYGCRQVEAARTLAVALGVEVR